MRKPRYVVRSAPRSRPRNVKSDIVMEREYYNQHLCREDVAEFDYRPSKCKVPFRIVVLRKIISHDRGQRLLHAEHRYLFYITNTDVPAERVVELANERCNQERTIGELKSGVNALRMPLGDLLSNWAYSVIATLAWNLSRWIGLVLPVRGRWTARHADEKTPGPQDAIPDLRPAHDAAAGADPDDRTPARGAAPRLESLAPRLLPRHRVSPSHDIARSSEARARTLWSAADLKARKNSLQPMNNSVAIAAGTSQSGAGLYALLTAIPARDLRLFDD